MNEEGGLDMGVGAQGNKVWFPKSKGQPGGYYDKAMGRHFSSRRQKTAYMKENGLREDGSMESERHRANRVVDEFNSDRERRGLKPKNVSEIVGNGPYAKYQRKFF